MDRTWSKPVMFETVKLVRSVHRCGAVLALGLAVALSPVLAASPFPALERPALQVKAPERQVLQAAVKAGERIVAIGERGLVVLSDDQGRRWRQARQVPVSVSLTALSFVDSQRGWAVGHGGVVLHTADGGETWTRQADGVALARAALAEAEQLAAQRPGDPAAERALADARRLVDDGADKPLLDVRFIDARRGWVVGAYNLFFETNDGGATWRSVSTRLDNPRALHLNALAVRGQTVFIAGEQGVLFRSLDAGQTFQALSSPYKGSWFSLAQGEDGAVTVAGLRGNAFRSADGGTTWTAIGGLPPVSIVSASARADGSVVLSNQAGQLFVSRADAPAQPLRVTPMPPLNGLLLLGQPSALALGFGGAISLDLSGAGK
jgi:photosystem II stability/assembly factor-like uncharacterized protein